MKISTQNYIYKWLLLAPPVGLLIAAIFINATEPSEGTRPVITFIHAIIISSGLWAGCMLIVNMLWKKFPWEHSPAKHIIYEIILILAYTNLFSFGLYQFELKLGIIMPMEDIYVEGVFTNLITFLITAIHEAAFFYKQWKLNFSKSVMLEKDNIEAKYETLKSQINPHFLFNSLNSLTTIVEDNNQAVDYVQNLSEFLRYVLKNRDREVVLLRDELSVLQKYVNLQKSRFKENLHVEIGVDEKVFHYSVPPLVIQMLVENCIKHNIISKDKPLKIFVYTEKDYLVVENTLQKKTEADSTGNGLNNIIQRYRFFTHNDVKITENSSAFKVSIPLLLVEI
jgi:two-component system LytT family sensor kinase